MGGASAPKASLGLCLLLPQASLNLGQENARSISEVRARELPEEMGMLTPEPLEMKPHVYCTWRGVGVGGASKYSWSHLSINWTFCSSLSVSFHLLNTISLKYQVCCSGFLVGGKGPSRSPRQLRKTDWRSLDQTEASSPALQV